MKSKEETKPVKDTPNNHSKAATILNELINKRKELMNNLKFEYASRAKDVSFCKYMDSKELLMQLEIVRLDLVRQRINKMIF